MSDSGNNSNSNNSNTNSGCNGNGGRNSNSKTHSHVAPAKTTPVKPVLQKLARVFLAIKRLRETHDTAAGTARPATEATTTAENPRPDTRHQTPDTRHQTPDTIHHQTEREACDRAKENSRPDTTP